MYWRKRDNGEPQPRPDSDTEAVSQSHDEGHTDSKQRNLSRGIDYAVNAAEYRNEKPKARSASFSNLFERFRSGRKQLPESLFLSDGLEQVPYLSDPDSARSSSSFPVRKAGSSISHRVTFEESNRPSLEQGSSRISEHEQPTQSSLEISDSSVREFDFSSRDSRPNEDGDRQNRPRASPLFRFRWKKEKDRSPLFRSSKMGSKQPGTSRKLEPHILAPRPSLAQSSLLPLASRSSETISSAPPTLGPTPVRSQSVHSSRSLGFGSTKRNSRPVSLRNDSVPSVAMDTKSSAKVSKSSFFTLRQRKNSECYISSGPPSEHSSQAETPPALGSPTFDYSKMSLPENHPNESLRAYLLRLMKLVPRPMLATVLSKSSFLQSTLREYLATFVFDYDPIDMSLRKFLMECKLPTETQQIDRVLDAFANRYHECNPGIFPNAETAFLIAFSLLMLHTDAFNKNNRHKMSKADYVKNTAITAVSAEVLECFYDNVTYTPFLHFDEDLRWVGRNWNGRIIADPQKWSNALHKGADSPKMPKGPIDPYILIMHNRLEILRPSLVEILSTEYRISFSGSSNELDVAHSRTTFENPSKLQVVSTRSRPDAYMSPMIIQDPLETRPGIVEVHANKIGILWRKEYKKNGRSFKGWRELGAILTDAQVFFSKDLPWVYGLLQQVDEHAKFKRDSEKAVVLEPPVQQLPHEIVLSVSGSIAFVDEEQLRKYTFAVVSRNGIRDCFAASTASEMDDWIVKINYVAALGAAKVNVRHTGTDAGIRRQLHTAPSRSSLRTVATNETGSASSGAAEMDGDDCRRRLLGGKLTQLQEQITSQTSQVERDLRDSRHLSALAPITSRTRERVVLAAGQLSARIKWTKIGLARLKCYSQILMAELDTLPSDPLPGSAASTLEVSQDIQSMPKFRAKNQSRLKRSSSIPQLPAFSFETGGQAATPSTSSIDPAVATVAERMERNGQASKPFPGGPEQPAPRRALQRSLREGNPKKNVESGLTEDQETSQRQGLHRSGDSFVMQGKFKFSVVDVNPDLTSASKHSRTISSSNMSQSGRAELARNTERMGDMAVEEDDVDVLSAPTQ